MSDKPVWTRCPGCKQRLFNDPIDIEAHKPLCPQLLFRRLKNLHTAMEKIDQRVDHLEQVEIPEPVAAVDLEEVADWPDEDGEPLSAARDADGEWPTDADQQPEYPLSIDRPEELTQDAMSGLYTPRNLI